MKKGLRLLSFTLSLLMLLTIVLPSSVKASSTEVELESISEEIDDYNFIEEIDNFVYLNSENKLNIFNETLLEKILNDNLLEANTLFNPDASLVNAKEIIMLIRERIDTVNQGVDNNELLIQNDKQIINLKQISTFAYGYSDWEHQLDHYWWGAKHIFRSTRASAAFAQELQTTANMAGAATFLLGGFPPAAGATLLTGLYLNQMANSINNKMAMYGRIFLNITYVLVFTTGKY